MRDFEPASLEVDARAFTFSLASPRGYSDVTGNVSTRGPLIPICRPVFRVPFLVPLLVSCAIASTPESVAPAEFHVKAPQAKRVSVVGTFNGWDPDAHRLQGPDRNGVWNLRFPLPPGQYRYMFVVDGVRWMADPNAVASQSDGFGGRNSLLFHGR